VWHIDTPTRHISVHAQEVLVPLLICGLVINEDFAAHHMNESVFQGMFCWRQGRAERGFVRVHLH
jgi:hypothetical protein